MPDIDVSVKFKFDPDKALDSVYQRIESFAMSEASRIANEGNFKQRINFPSTRHSAKIKSLQEGE